MASAKALAARRRFLDALAALLVAGACGGAFGDEEVRVCPSCGTEAASAIARFCASCGAALDMPPSPLGTGDGAASDAASPRAQERDAATREREPERGVRSTFSTIGQDEIDAAVSAVFAADSAIAKDAHDKAVRLAACRNSLRAAAIFDGTIPQSSIATLTSAKNDALSALASPLRERCPECGGSGVSSSVAKKGAEKTGSSRHVHRIEDVAVGFSSDNSAQVCGFCGGAGSLLRARDRASVLDSERLGAAAFSRLAEAKGRVDALGVWWPAPFAAKLRAQDSSKTSRAMRSSVKDDCLKCAGVGTVRCASCKGWGKKRGKNGIFDRCADCSGRGYVSCRTCGGLGNVR